MPGQCLYTPVKNCPTYTNKQKVDNSGFYGSFKSHIFVKLVNIFFCFCFVSFFFLLLMFLQQEGGKFVVDNQTSVSFDRSLQTRYARSAMKKLVQI